MNSVWQLQKAVYAALTGDVTLMGLVEGVYDYVPQGSDYPYVTVGDMQASDWSTPATSGVQVKMGIRIYTHDTGRKTAADIIQRVYELLHGAELVVTGKTLVSFFYEGSEIMLSKDGAGYEGVATFSASLLD